MKLKIQEAIKAIEDAVAHLDELRRSCNHHIVPDHPEWIEASGGICEHCGKTTFGWYCPNNPPSHECEYTRGECCIHCHQPEERK